MAAPCRGGGLAWSEGSESNAVGSLVLLVGPPVLARSRMQTQTEHYQDDHHRPFFLLWTIYRRAVRKREQFHQQKLQSILNIEWEDYMMSSEVLKCTNSTASKQPS